MNDEAIDILELITDALAAVYSGATSLETDALIDALSDRGLFIVPDINDTRTLHTPTHGI